MLLLRWRRQATNKRTSVWRRAAAASHKPSAQFIYPYASADMCVFVCVCVLVRIVKMRHHILCKVHTVLATCVCALHGVYDTRRK